MAASAGLRRVGAEAERGLTEEGGDWRAASGVGPGAVFTFSLPSGPSQPSHSTPPCLPVSLGNLQLKASHPHGNMYPSNKKKKVWREEKGNGPPSPGVRVRVDKGWGRGSGLCVPWCPPPELPSARAPASRPAEPTGAASLVCPCVRTRAPTAVHAPPPGPCRSRTCGRTPLVAPAATRHLPGRGCLSLTRGLDTGSPPRSPGPAQLPSLVPHPGSTLVLGLSHAQPACPTDTPAGGHTRCGRRRRASAPRASFRHSSPLPTAPSAYRVSPPSGADPFSWSPTSAPHGALKPGTLLRGNLKERLVREDECLPRHLSGLLLCARCFSPIHRLQWPRVRV